LPPLTLPSLGYPLASALVTDFYVHTQSQRTPQGTVVGPGIQYFFFVCLSRMVQKDTVGPLLSCGLAHVLGGPFIRAWGWCDGLMELAAGLSLVDEYVICSLLYRLF
jgi:hypothetical protein